MKTDSILKRYSVTLFVNFFQLVSGVINSTIVPNTLGPVSYGNFQFLTNTAAAIRNGLNLGSTGAFFTYSSKNIRSGNAFFIFFVWTVCQLILVMAFVSLSIVFRFTHIIFPDQSSVYIIVLTLLEWTNYISTMLIQFGETKAESLSVQRVNFIANFVKLALTFLLYKTGLLNLNSFIALNYVGSVIILALIVLYFFQRERRDRYFEPIGLTGSKTALKYFITYGTPLIIYEVFGYVNSYLDRWLLQIVSGSMQQAYFSIGYSWASVTMLFSTSVVHIFWREISFAHGSGDLDRIKRIYAKSSQALFFMTSFISLALAFQAEQIVKLFLHEEYAGVVTVLRIMAFCPMLDTMGQLNAVCMYATEQVKPYRNIAIGGYILSDFLLYFLVAPGSYIVPGLGLQSTGLAIKFLLHSLALMIVQTYVVTRYLNLRMTETFFRKMAALLLLILANGGASLLSRQSASDNNCILVLFLTYYIALAGVLVYVKPSFAGLTADDMTNVKNTLARYITRLGRKEN